VLIGISLQCYSADTDSLSVKSDTSLVKKSKSLPANFPKSKLLNYAIPAVCIGYGFFSLNNDFLKITDRAINSEMREDHPNFKTNIDDQLQYAPMIAVYGLNLLGVKSKNNFIDKTAIYFISNALMGVSVDFLKVKTHKLDQMGRAVHFLQAIPPRHS
jgi:hypothetical protein